MQTVQTVTLEDVIALVVPPTSGGYLRLLSGDVERFFQPLGSRWSGLPGQPDGVDASCTAHNADTGVSPITWNRPVTGSPMRSCAVLWVVRRYALLAEQRGEPHPRVAADERERTLDTLARSPRTGFPPSVVIDGGDHAVALWRIEPAIGDVAQLQTALDTLSRAFGSERVDPVEALIPVPATRCTRVYPSVIVRVVAFEPTRVYPINLDKLIS